MIDFSTLQGLTIPEGAVAQIADASGRVIWTGGKPVVLQVEKIISNTGAGETTYENEEFILLDIYPKTNGTVSVTYGGLTKTITDTSGVAEPNAQQVYFGTFNGVSDSVTTPTSGELTIRGSYNGFGCGSFRSAANKITATTCSCITAVTEFGAPRVIPDAAFKGCDKLTDISVPEGITTLGNLSTLIASVFASCTNLTNVKLPSSLRGLGASSFINCKSLTSIAIPDGVSFIPSSCFNNCDKLTDVLLPSGLSSINNDAFYYCQNLIMIEIPEGVLSIEDKAFYMPNKNAGSTYYPDYIPVTKMAGATITLPSTIKKIGKNVWGYDGNSVNGNFYINNLVILATTPPEIPADGLGDLGFTITVPKGCAEAYKAAENWHPHSGQIVEAS